LARLRDELQTVRAEGEDAKVKLARIEGERKADETRQAQEQRAQQMKQTLLRFGAVKETERGTVLTLPETLWAGVRAADLSPKASALIEPLAALLANNPDYRVVIEAYTDSKGDQAALQKLTQDRADTLAAQLSGGGVEGARIQAAGMGAANPLAPNTTLNGRARNRRVEIILAPAANRINTATN
jgi:outer membrane protein OmpA-like peptidoglycan-associated protein